MGTGRTISPSGSTTVVYGGTQTYTITPTSGYSVANVLVDGSSVGSITSYVFSNVIASHTISATFAANSVIPASRVYLNSVKTSDLVSGGYIQFTVRGSNAWIRHGGGTL